MSAARGWETELAAPCYQHAVCTVLHQVRGDDFREIHLLDTIL